MYRLIGAGGRELGYKASIYEALAKRGIDIAKYLGNHSGNHSGDPGDPNFVFDPELRDWLVHEIHDPNFGLPDQYEADGCPKEVVEGSERNALIIRDRKVQGLLKKFKELGLYPLPPEGPQDESANKEPNESPSSRSAT